MNRQLDPNTPPIGRMPERVQIAPSKSYPWYGNWRVGHRFTVAQEAELAKRGIDAAEAPWILVKRQATPREMWWPTDQLPPVFAFDCPVLGERGEQVRIIAPNGDVRLVAADGWSQRPFTRLRDSMGYKI